LNLYLGVIGFGFFTDGKRTFISPILTEAFSATCPDQYSVPAEAWVQRLSAPQRV
jgi:hypothetical protein